MRLICGVAGTVAAALFAVSAHAVALPPLPLPPPPVPVPSLPTPTLPTPTVPAPNVPAPTIPTPPVPTPTPTTPAPVTPQPPAAPAQPAPASPSTTASPQAAALAPKQTAHARRTAKRRVLTHFRLVHAGRILVFVRELAPVCRTLGRYRFAAHKGANTLHLPARIKKPGSYAFVGRLHGRKVFSVETRVGQGRRVLLGATTTSVCPARLAAVVSKQTAASAPELHVKHASASRGTRAIGDSPRGGSPLVRAVSLQDAPASVRPLLFTLLALAILLLATAAAPQRLLPAGRAATVIAHQRVYLAAAGICLVVAVAVATALA